MPKCSCGQWLVSYEAACTRCKEICQVTAEDRCDRVEMPVPAQPFLSVAAMKGVLHDSDALQNDCFRRVSFTELACEAIDVTPIACRFGVHPRHFHFDRFGKKLPLNDIEWTEKGICELRNKQGGLYAHIGNPREGDQVLVDQLLPIAKDLELDYESLRQRMLKSGAVLEMSVKIDDLLWTSKGVTSISRHMPLLYERIDSPVAEEVVTDEHLRMIADEIGILPRNAMRELLRSQEIQKMQVNADLRWTAEGVRKASKKCPQLLLALGQPAENSRLSAVHVKKVSDFFGKSFGEVTQQLFDSGDVCHAPISIY